MIKPSDKCKAAGLESLAELVRLTGESEQNLINWSNKRPGRFDILLNGVYMEKERIRLHKVTPSHIQFIMYTEYNRLLKSNSQKRAGIKSLEWYVKRIKTFTGDEYSIKFQPDTFISKTGLYYIDFGSLDKSHISFDTRCFKFRWIPVNKIMTSFNHRFNIPV